MFYMLEMWLITAVSQSVSSTKIDPLRFTGSAYGGFAFATYLRCTNRNDKTAQNNVQYSIGAGYQNSPEFKNLAQAITR
jgi:hypothetical protein